MSLLRSSTIQTAGLSFSRRVFSRAVFYARASDWVRRTAAAGIFLLLAVPVFVQATGNAAQTDKTLATIRGNLSTTQESAGTGLVGITVKLSPEPPNGNTLTADTDDAGHYEFLNVQPGSYTISVGQAGFKALKKAVSVTAGQTVALDITLDIETVAEQV